MFIKKKITKYFPFIFWPLLFISLLILFWPSFTNFFFGDDLFNAVLGRADNLKGVLNFFNILKAPPNFLFYRPLTIQFFFWLGFRLFQINPLGYHLVSYLFFLINLILLFKLTKKILSSSTIAYLTVFFYAFSHSHFTRIYFISLCQEFILTAFYLLAIICYINFIQKHHLKNLFFSTICFILALLCKETALSLPMSIILVDTFFLKEKKNWSKYIMSRVKYFLPFLITFIVYSIPRFFLFGFTKEGNYQLVFKLRSTINTILWYFLWSLGLPETFVNIKILDHRYLINPRFMQEFGDQGAIITLLFALMFPLILISLKEIYKLVKRKNNYQLIKKLLFCVLWFLTTIILISFYPFHKFSYSVTLSLIGVAISLSLLSLAIYDYSKIIFAFFLTLYLLVSITANNFAYKNYWSRQRATLSKKIYNYLKINHSDIEEKALVYFYDIDYCRQEKLKFPLSEEVDFTLNGSSGVNFFYNTKEVLSLYQYQTPLEEFNNINMQKMIFVDVRQFFKKEDN